jgi:ferredoxin-thioredoxin reductase catalytic chain
MKPTQTSLIKIEHYVEKYREKTGTSAHPNPEVPASVIKGLAYHLDVLGQPLCPCNYYPDKKAQVEKSREWNCACDQMKKWKYCHCLLFVTPDGQPITEYLPEDHEGRKCYGLVLDPTPDKGREGCSNKA